MNKQKREIKRKQGVIIRRIRDTKIAHDVKKLYNYECQICKFTIITKSGNYSEGAHIKPLGIPHDGDDNPDNLLCLCPNHHRTFDVGAWTITDDLKVKDLILMMIQIITLVLKMLVFIFILSMDMVLLN